MDDAMVSRMAGLAMVIAELRIQLENLQTENADLKAKAEAAHESVGA